MSADAPASTPTTEPDPHRAGAGVPGAVGRVLLLVRRLIDYGKQLAGTMQQRATAPGFAWFARSFGTADLALILARITAGLRRAAALEARLCARAARGRDLTPSPIRLPAPCAGRKAAPTDAQPEPKPADHAEDPLLARLPSEEEIAAEVRRRPVGAVIVDICLDLGIAPGDLDRAFWDELQHAIIMFGGSVAGWLGNLRRQRIRLADLPDDACPEWPPPPLRLTAPATGPP
jgi:hypothetical protein